MDKPPALLRHYVRRAEKHLVLGEELACWFQLMDAWGYQDEDEAPAGPEQTQLPLFTPFQPDLF